MLTCVIIHKQRREAHMVAKHILVVGGGIGGLATAIGLWRAGLEATVFERADALREVGAGLLVGANGLRALSQLGVGDAVRVQSVPGIVGGFYTSAGRPLATMSMERLTQLVGEQSLVMHRADLLAILRGALPAEAVQLGAACESFEQDGQGVALRLAGGRVARGDALIGADGINSAVRAALFGGGPPRYAGYTGWRGVASFPHERLLPGELWGRGARFGMAPMSGGRVYWFATSNRPAGAPDAPGGRKAELLALLSGWHPSVSELVAATDEAAILRHDISDREPLARWAVGRVALLGDAAHAMTPNLGQGACQALEDAVVLARCLGGASDVPAALQAYQQARIPRANALVRQSRRVGEVGQWSNPLACALRDTLTRLLLPLGIERQLRETIGYVA
jgi:2-polyprenyl-6-methoxyphenol hydroxylase-like FAD-dependent oxidoreductase